MNMFEVVLNILFQDDSIGNSLCNLTDRNRLVVELIGGLEGVKFLFDRSDVFVDFVHDNSKVKIKLIIIQFYFLDDQK